MKDGPSPDFRAFYGLGRAQWSADTAGVTPSQRAPYGKIGAAVARSAHDPRDLTSEARRRFLARFEAQATAEHPELPRAEIQRRAAELRKAHMLTLSA
jgi:hypothetical protein